MSEEKEDRKSTRRDYPGLVWTFRVSVLKKQNCVHSFPCGEFYCLRTVTALQGMRCAARPWHTAFLRKNSSPPVGRSRGYGRGAWPASHDWFCNSTFMHLTQLLFFPSLCTVAAHQPRLTYQAELMKKHKLLLWPFLTVENHSEKW